jgi:hypothetical protein
LGYPVSSTVTERIPTPGCEHPHGQALNVADQMMFVGCEAKPPWSPSTCSTATSSTTTASATPPTWCAAESGWVTVFDQARWHLKPWCSAHLADGAHTLSLDPATHHTYIPIPHGGNGSPVLREWAPT